MLSQPRFDERASLGVYRFGKAAELYARFFCLVAELVNHRARADIADLPVGIYSWLLGC